MLCGCLCGCCCSAFRSAESSANTTHQQPTWPRLLLARWSTTARPRHPGPPWPPRPGRHLGRVSTPLTVTCAMGVLGWIGWLAAVLFPMAAVDRDCCCCCSGDGDQQATLLVVNLDCGRDKGASQSARDASESQRPRQSLLTASPDSALIGSFSFHPASKAKKHCFSTVLTRI